ncbi:MAG: metal ABC transporter permease [Planctomycetes bacterium]|nr:metal ABC transporter permease [Planctomycetota bacterium]
MTADWPWYLLPLITAFILVTIHTYLGLHVISRKVLFVDLALAQIAALGSTVAFLFGFEVADPVTYYVSLLFTIVGAWVFSITRMRGERIPQEAIIGLAFAIASAGSILFSAENPHGAEHLRDIMAGSILFVTPSEIVRTTIFYGAIGLFHLLFYPKFILISTRPEEAAERGLNVKMWDFLFYLSFAVVITSSVRIAGVLLVFCLLVAPAVCGALFAERLVARLLIGWACGLLAAVGGLGLSGRYDWPPAPAIVCVFAGILIGAGVTGHIRRAARPGMAAVRAGAGALLLTALGFGLVGFLRSDLARSLGAERRPSGARAVHSPPAVPEEAHGHGAEEHSIGGTLGDLRIALRDEHSNVRARAVEGLAAQQDRSVIPDLLPLLRDSAPAVQEAAAKALSRLGAKEAVPELIEGLSRPVEDEWVPLEFSKALAELGEVRGLDALALLAAAGEARLVREEALRTVLGLSDLPPPAVPDPTPREALARWNVWRASSGAEGPRWDAVGRRFCANGAGPSRK